MPNGSSGYASVVLDVDSTLCGIEGIDFLAARRGEEVGAEIARVTDRAMRGEIALEQVYGERLKIIRPTRDDIAALADAYRRALAPGAADVIAALRARGVRIVLVSGGIRQAIEPVAQFLDFALGDLHAVSLTFHDAGNYDGFDSRSPLATQHGKAEVVARLIEAGALVRPVLAVGDGATDVAMAEAADTFAAYTGFARRLNVVSRAAFELSSFAELKGVVEGRMPRARN
jgi:phosphoserine phosphatase